MSTQETVASHQTNDPVSNILKWVLLIVAVSCFAVLGWTTKLTYDAAPPFPDRFVTTTGALLMSSGDIVAGKAGFQNADLMDYGSLYGMGSYFGEDYTASTLVRLATLTEANIAMAQHRQDAREPDGGSAGGGHGGDADRNCRASILRKQAVVVPAALAAAMITVRGCDRAVAVASRLRARDGRKPTASIRSPRRQTADFLVYSSLTTVARRPGTTGPGPRTGRSNRWSATRRPPAPSVGPGSASASPFSPSARCCSSTSAF